MPNFGEEFHIFTKPPEDLWDAVVGAGWQKNVLTLLRRISASKAGIALLRAIQGAGLPVLIVPPIQYECNARQLGRAIVGGTLFGAVVSFDPEVYAHPESCFGKGQTYGTFPNEVLFHELVHALRRAKDINRAKPSGGGLYRYQNSEEFLAVVITNVYISDVTNSHSSGLRRDHTDHQRLDRGLSGSLTFYKSSAEVLPLIETFASQQADFFDALASVQASFNPFEALKDCKQAVQQETHSRLAGKRDAVGPYALATEIAMGAGKSLLRGITPNSGPGLKEFAGATLGPLAQQALAVLQR